METSQQFDDSRANYDSENASKVMRTQFLTTITSRSQPSPVSFAQSNEDVGNTHFVRNLRLKTILFDFSHPYSDSY